MDDGKGGVRLKGSFISKIALFSALIIVMRLFKLPLHIPGAGSAPWLGVMIIARGLSDYAMTTTLIGLIVGVIAFGMDMPPGPWHIVKYVVAGMIIDIMDRLLLRRTTSSISYGLTGALAGFAKVLGIYIIALLLSLPVFIIHSLLVYAVALNGAFGFVVGIIAYHVVEAVRRHHVGSSLA